MIQEAAEQGRPREAALRVGAVVGTVVAAAVVVFGLGVMVGKRVAESVPTVAAPPAALPTENIQPVAAAVPRSGAVAPDQLTFYDRLSGVAPAASVALPEGQAPAPAASTPAPGPSASPAPAPKPAPPTSAATPARVAAKAPSPKPKAPADSAAGRIRKLAGAGRYAVQVASASDRAAAEATAARVRGEGFETQMVMVSVKGKIWYRIRTGSFPNKRAAAQAAGIFHTAYGFDAIAVQQ